MWRENGADERVGLWAGEKSKTLINYLGSLLLRKNAFMKDRRKDENKQTKERNARKKKTNTSSEGRKTDGRTNIKRSREGNRRFMNAVSTPLHGVNVKHNENGSCGKTHEPAMSCDSDTQETVAQSSSSSTCEKIRQRYQPLVVSKAHDVMLKSTLSTPEGHQCGDGVSVGGFGRLCAGCVRSNTEESFRDRAGWVRALYVT